MNPLLLAALLAAPFAHAARPPLPSRGDAGEARFLVSVLNDEGQDASVRLRALRTLGRTGEPALPVLKSYIENDFADFAFRIAAIRGLACAGSHAIGILEKAITSSPSYKDATSPDAVVIAAIQSIRYAGPEATPILITVVESSSDSDEQEAKRLLEAVKGLGYTGGPKALPALQAVVLGPNRLPATKSAAIEAIGRLGKKTFNPCELEQMREGLAN